MRSCLRAMLLALAINPFLPEVALCQDHEDFVDDEPPPPQRIERRRGRPWRNSPIVWGAVSVGLALAIPYSLYKLYCGMQQWKLDQAREKEPWERAMEEAERAKMRERGEG